RRRAVQHRAHRALRRIRQPVDPHLLLDRPDHPVLYGHPSLPSALAPGAPFARREREPGPAYKLGAMPGRPVARSALALLVQGRGHPGFISPPEKPRSSIGRESSAGVEESSYRITPIHTSSQNEKRSIRIIGEPPRRRPKPRRFAEASNGTRAA